uniref:G protein-coupled receptor 119 n=1 Tax=Oryzias sinensis TaxID=183150 RepID=A0A8C7YXY8_9TELE
MDSKSLEAGGSPNPRVMGIVLSTASCLIISTNIVVAAALLKLLIKKSSQSWCFVLNLALADIFVGVAITGLATEDFGKVTLDPSGGGPVTNSTPPASGRARCLFRMAFVTSPCTASIMSMFLISLDRYAAIKMPLHYSLLSGRWTAAGSLLVVWICSFVTGFLPVMVQQLQAKTTYNGFCAFFSVIHDIGVVVLFSTLFFPVLSLFIYMYLDILKIAYTHQRQISRVRQASSRSTTSDQGHPHYLHHHHHHHHLRSSDWSHVKALRTVAVLVGCFMVLWCPFFVVCIVHILCESCRLKHVLENYLWLLGLSNSLINPVVYAFWQREVRLQLAAMFSCIRGRWAAGVLERSPPLPPVQSQHRHSEAETPSPSLLLPDTGYENRTAPLSAITTL